MTEDHPFNNRTMYGATKIAGEQFLRAFHEQHGLDYVGLRYMNVYGPRMDDKGAYVSVIMKVLDRIDARRARRSIYGDGSQAYDFVHVADVARANVLAMESSATDAAYNVGTGMKTTINELVDELLAHHRLAIWSPSTSPTSRCSSPTASGSTEAAASATSASPRAIGWREGLRTVVDSAMLTG